MKLNVVDLNFAYNGTPVLKDVSFSANKKITAVIGPNGAGKSTLMSCIAGIQKPAGQVYLDDTEVTRANHEKIATSVSYLPQDTPSKAVVTVLEAVLLGRLHTLRWKVDHEDLEIAYETLSDLGIESLAKRTLNQLSGGQRQMVSIAQAIVKEPEVMLMDEPTNSLDLQHQLELFDLIHEISEERNITSLIALHDLNLAARYAENIVVLDSGNVCSCGTPDQVLTSEMIEQVYGVHADVSTDPDGYVHVCPKCSVKGKKRRKNREINT